MIDVVVLLREASWGTQPVEEQHGSIAVMHKYNGELAAHHLCLRSFIHSARFLCVRPDNAFARHTEMAVKRLEKKQPGKVRGQHMFAADAVAAARRQLGPASPVTFEGSRRVVTHSAHPFSALPPRVAAAYAAKARAHSAARKDAIASEVSFLRTQFAFGRRGRAEG